MEEFFFSQWWIKGHMCVRVCVSVCAWRGIVHLVRATSRTGIAHARYCVEQ